MGKWEARKQGKKPGDVWVVQGEFEWIKCIAPSEDIARQIAREHNAHGKLVEMVQDFREFVEGLNREDDLPLQGEKDGIFSDIDAVLARAEGRE